MSLRIGVDATCWANGRGYGRFARELLRELVVLAPEHRFLCVGDRRALEAFPLEAANLERVEVALTASPTEAAAADGSRSPRDLLRLTRAVWRLSPDVFFSPSVYTYFPLPPGQRAVVTVHDAIAERFPDLTLPSARARWFWRLKVRLALRQARLVLTVSDFAARELEQIHGLPRSRIRVALEAPAAEYYPTSPEDAAAEALRAGVPPAAPWFTYVGGFSPHKRLDVVIRAHAALTASAAAPAHLLLVGRTSGDAFLSIVESLRQMVRSAGTDALVHWTGYVPDAKLRALHTGAVACLLPSECEGFGLPAVEAAACGTPVIATTESPLPELLRGGGLFVRPGDVEGLTAAMRTLLDDRELRCSAGRIARTRAGALSWRAAAASTLGALLEAAA